MKLRESGYSKESFNHLKIDCSKCFGFCCVALYFSKCDGFPKDKCAGKPCEYLNHDFTCMIHQELRMKGLKGCTTYDCFGAGQKVAQLTYKGQSWKDNETLADEMFSVFLVMRQLHEMLWYLTDALTFHQPEMTKAQLSALIKETEKLTLLDASSLLTIDLEAHRLKVNSCLHQVTDDVNRKAKVNQKGKTISGFDFIGKNLMKSNLTGANFAGALLIAANLSHNDLSGANLIGADLRDADIRGANLSQSLFLTQAQINSAKGNVKTRLPASLQRPTYWNNK